MRETEALADATLSLDADQSDTVATQVTTLVEKCNEMLSVTMKWTAPYDSVFDCLKSVKLFCDEGNELARVGNDGDDTVARAIKQAIEFQQEQLIYLRTKMAAGFNLQGNMTGIQALFRPLSPGESRAKLLKRFTGGLKKRSHIIAATQLMAAISKELDKNPSE